MAGEFQPTMGDIRPHGHLKLGRFTQHFIDVLDLEKTPLEFFEEQYPTDAREEQRKYLGRFGVSGRMQVQKMAELSDGQKSRVVFAKLGRDVPHILLLGKFLGVHDTYIPAGKGNSFCLFAAHSRRTYKPSRHGKY
jgi:ATP-binding cassette subfamily F protein 2